MIKKLLAVALIACAAALGGCVSTESARGWGQIAAGVGAVVGPTKADPQIAKVSARLAERCATLQVAAVGADLFAPTNLRDAVRYGDAVITTFCAAPPKTAAELATAIAKVVEAITLIEQAKRAV